MARTRKALKPDVESTEAPERAYDAPREEGGNVRPADGRWIGTKEDSDV